MSRMGRSTFSTRSLSAAQIPMATPITTAMAVATSTWEAVSMPGSQTPMTPIAASIRSAVTAGRIPLSTKAIRVRPPRVTNQGDSTSRRRSGSRKFVRMKFPIGSVIWKISELGS